jgi:hypothetical protein
MSRGCLIKVILVLCTGWTFYKLLTPENLVINIPVLCTFNQCKNHICATNITVLRTFNQCKNSLCATNIPVLRTSWPKCRLFTAKSLVRHQDLLISKQQSCEIFVEMHSNNISKGVEHRNIDCNFLFCLPCLHEFILRNL